MVPETRDCWWDPRPEIRDPTHRWDRDSTPRTLKVGPETRDPRPNSEVDPGPETRDPKSGVRDLRPGTLKVSEFSANFLSFLCSLACMNEFICLCVYVCFVCFPLPYHKTYTLLILYHLNELPFPRFFPCSFFRNFQISDKTSDNSKVPYIEQWKIFKLMEKNKLNHNKESDPQRRLKKIAVLIIW